MSLIDFNFDPSARFDPSASTKEFGMFTRKANRAFDFNFPGFYNTSHLNLTILGFVMIFVVEGFATFLAHSLAVKVIAIIIAIFVDIILAVFSHMFHAKITINKNRQIFSEDGPRIQLKTKLGPMLVFKNIFYSFIIISGFFKFILFYLGYQGVDFICVGIFLCYMVGAMLHISCTGYLLYTIYFGIKIHSEYGKYKSSGMTRYSYDLNNPQITPIESSISLNEAQRGNHRVRRTLNTNAQPNYAFESCGIMNDSDLNFLISKQSSAEQRIVVAKYGIKHQYENMGLGGIQITNTPINIALGN